MPDRQGPKTVDLITAGVVTDERVDAAVAAVMADPCTGRFAVADGLHLDLAAVVRHSRRARMVLRDLDATEGLRRGLLRRAILDMRPAKT